MDTIVKKCQLCEEQFDFLPNSGEKEICDDCKEIKCKICGGELEKKFNRCKECSSYN